MNPIFRAAADATTMGWLLADMTVVFFLFFAGWAWYAYRPGNRDLMEAAARMPLDDGGEA